MSLQTALHVDLEDQIVPVGQPLLHRGFQRAIAVLMDVRPLIKRIRGDQLVEPGIGRQSDS